MRKTKRYEFIVDGIVLYVTSGSIKEGVFFVFLLWCILSFIVKCLWEAQLPQGSVRFELDWTEHPSQGNVENKQWADPRNKAAQLLVSQRKYGPLWDWFLLIKDTDEQRKY